MIILPAAIIVSDAGVKSFNTSKFFISRIKSRITQLWYSAAARFDIVFNRLIPQFVYFFRIPLILLAVAAFVISVYAIVRTPGIRLPERNSVQVNYLFKVSLNYKTNNIMYAVKDWSQQMIVSRNFN